jgi:hypothetical protein
MRRASGGSSSDASVDRFHEMKLTGQRLSARQTLGHASDVHVCRFGRETVGF